MSEYYVNSQHMLIGPNVRHELLPEALRQQEIQPWSIILHSNAGPRKTPWESLKAFMAREDITGESHFLVDMDGTVVQLMPLNRRADCNYKANSFTVPFYGSKMVVGAISFETQDEGYGTLDRTPWTLPQVTAIANAVAAIGHKYGVPYVQPARWSDQGVGHHCLFPEWSIYKGKTCPGRARIQQMDFIRMQAASICACAPEGA